MGMEGDGQEIGFRRGCKGSVQGDDQRGWWCCDLAAAAAGRLHADN